MPRASSRKSVESTETDADGLAEQELLRLHQEYRVMEGDRKAYSEESLNMIRKQRETIASLQLENEELSRDHHLAGSQQNQTNDNNNTDKLSSLLKVEDTLKVQISKARSRITKLEQSIQQIEKNISHQRKFTSAHKRQARHTALQKHIRVLENRLDQGNKKFNEGLATNSKLREEIDHLRTERLIFDGIQKKLEKKLHSNKDEITEVITASTSAYDARDDSQSKMLALKEKCDKEYLQYNLELKELMRVIDHDRKLREFMNVKSEDRTMMKNLEPVHRGSNEKDKRHVREDAIQSFEEAFHQIQIVTGLDDLQLLVGKFIQTEDRNFALFNYVNEINNDIEMKQEQIREINGEIEKFQKDSQNMDTQRLRVLQDLENLCLKVEEETSSFLTSQLSTNDILDELLTGVDSIFKSINCDASSIVDMLGSHVGITQSNIIQHLGIIEQRVNELLQVRAFIACKKEQELDEDDEDVTMDPELSNLIGQSALPLPTPHVIQPLGTGDDFDSDFSAMSDVEDRPLTQKELKQRIIDGIGKQISPKKKERQLGINGGSRKSSRNRQRKQK